MMALAGLIQRNLSEALSHYVMHQRSEYYSKKVDLKGLKSLILKRVKNRAGTYPVQRMIPVAQEVFETRKALIQGISALLKVVPVKACRFCPEVYIGKEGHQIKTCWGPKRMIKDSQHTWIDGSVNDVLIPVEAFHIDNMFHEVIEHNRRFDFSRVPAVLELCSQAGVDVPDELLHKPLMTTGVAEAGTREPYSLSQSAVAHTAKATLEAWERHRLGVQKLLLVYPAKACQHCREVHIGSSGHRARMCGVFKFEPWRGPHRWKRAEVDDLVPTNIVWHRRPHDPLVLHDRGREFYGKAPAVVGLCVQAGAKPDTKYNCMMKPCGLASRLGTRQ